MADAETLFAQALDLLTGASGHRDIPLARTRLRAAGMLGHADAELIEVALTANGSGGPRDWPDALARLKNASARHLAGASAQLALVDAMALDEKGYPRSPPDPEILSESTAVVLYRGLVTAAECEAIVTAVADIMAPAVVIDPATGRQMRHPIRTSDGAVVGPTRENLPVAAINRRLALVTGTLVEQGEALAVLRYRPGEQYRMHHDAIDGVANQRVKTALLYLNDGYSGGETSFPDLGLRIAGRTGDLLVFDNLLRDGRPDPRARHAGLPVQHGTKWLATRWIRQRQIDPWDPATYR